MSPDFSLSPLSNLGGSPTQYEGAFPFLPHALARIPHRRIGVPRYLDSSFPLPERLPISRALALSPPRRMRKTPPLGADAAPMTRIVLFLLPLQLFSELLVISSFAFSRRLRKALFMLRVR